MKNVTVYEKPTCTTCRKTIKILNEMGISFEKINYYIKPFTKSKLSSLLKKMDMKPSELLRKNDNAFKQLNFRENNYTENEILQFMVSDHDLIQRPIVEFGEKAILARPAEKIKELFNK